MEKFIVSARKYRPQNFNTVVGQSHITTTLKNAIKNQQLAHAFLFCGPRGVGKTTCARILAKTINCDDLQPDGEACNKCPSCVSFNEGGSLNIHELDAASNNSVDDIRELVDQVRYAPQSGKYKVYIIDEVHMLSQSAFNAFLKTLEEPPSYAIFILATTEKHKILPTILSRCQIYDFKRITTADTVDHLQEIADKEHIVSERAALQLIAQKSEGCMRDSLSILDKIVSFTNGSLTYQNTLEHLNILDHDYFFQLLEHQLSQDMAGSMLLYDEINRKGFEGDLVLNGYAEFIRNLLVAQNPKAASLLEVVEGLQPRYVEMAKKVATGFLIGALNILNEAEINYKMARNKRLHVEMTLIKLTFLQQAVELTYDTAGGSVVQKKRVSGPVALRFDSLRSLQVKPGVLPQPKTVADGPKLVIKAKEEPSVKAVVKPPTEVQPAMAMVSEPVVENTAPIPAGTTAPARVPKPRTSGARKSLLDTIRDQHDASQKSEEKEVLPLTEELLHQQWERYKEQLVNQGKSPTHTAFKQARLELVDENTFIVRVGTGFEQKFVMGERLALLDQLKEVCNNRSIGFEVIIDEKPVVELPAEATMTARQKYQMLVELNPHIQDLKEKLKLNLD